MSTDTPHPVSATFSLEPAGPLVHPEIQENLLNIIIGRGQKMRLPQNLKIIHASNPSDEDAPTA